MYRWLTRTGQFYSNQSFAQRFGQYDAVGEKWQIPARWQTGLSCAVQIGSILGELTFIYHVIKSEVTSRDQLLHLVDPPRLRAV